MQHVKSADNKYWAEVIQYSRDMSGRWKKAEGIQMQMGRRILGCRAKTTNAAVKGEMGWQSLKARRDMLRMTYWGKVVSMSRERWVRRIYDESRRRHEEDGQQSWCTYTHHILKEYGLEGEWEKGDTGMGTKEWKARVNAAIKNYEVKSGQKKWSRSQS